MKLGIFTFNTEYTIRAHELAIAAEERGFESVWFPEHTHVPASRETPFPAGGELPREYVDMLDPLTSCAAAAVVTKTLIVGSAVCLMNEHDIFALANAVASVDILSGGRFEFGVGAGWIAEEMRNHGFEFKDRWPVLEDRLMALKTLWTEDESTHHGKFVTFDRVWSYPKPLQKPHPPIVLGTLASEWGRKRTAKYADGWIPVDGMHGEKLEEDIADLHQKLSDQGRDPGSMRISICDNQPTDPDRLRRLADSGAVYRAIPRCPTEDKDSVLSWMDDYAKLIDELA
ncbi:MAG: LLM class F420-dependent oxidoreductase [Pseudomonadota bacterium]